MMYFTSPNIREKVTYFLKKFNRLKALLVLPLRVIMIKDQIASCLLQCSLHLTTASCHMAQTFLLIFNIAHSMHAQYFLEQLKAHYSTSSHIKAA